MEWTKQLSNENIVFLYLENVETLSQYEKIIKNKGIKTEVELPIFGKQTHFHPVDEKILLNIKESRLLKHLKEIDVVLEPIALLIKDSDPNLFQQVEDSINVKFDI